MLVSPVVALVSGVSLLTALLAVYGWRRRQEPGGRAFAALMAAAAVWAGVYAVGLAIPPGQETLRVTVGRVTFLGVVAVPVAWVAFAATYAGDWTDRRRTRRYVAVLSVVPAIGLVAALTNPAHGLLFTDATVVEGRLFGQMTTVSYDHGPLFGVVTGYGYALVAVGTALLLRTAVTADELCADQAVALAVGAVVPALSSVAAVLGIVPVPGLDLTPAALGITGITLANALARYSPLDRSPATRRLGRAAVVENVSEGVVVVDGDGEVTDVNSVVECLAGSDRESLLGERVDRALSPVVDDVAGDLKAAADLDGEVVQVGDDWFEVRVSSLSSRVGGTAGDVLTLRNVTDRRAREQRLQVMNRLLRHNFRNEVTVVHGFAELLDDRLDGDEGEMAARVHEVSAELVERVEKASGLERIATLTDLDPDAVDLERLARNVAEEYRDTFSESEIRVETADEPVFARVVLENAETILRNLLGNAVEHNDTDRPTVEMAVRRVDDQVEVTVVDDGPGLPRHERAVLDAGRETDLEHGSGLGLWIVHWGVQAAGGEVQFEDAEPRGTVVRVRFPAADPDETDRILPERTERESAATGQFAHVATDEARRSESAAPERSSEPEPDAESRVEPESPG